MSRVAGVDPGTVSFDVCVLDDGDVILERSFSTRDVGADPVPLVETLSGHGPFDLVLAASAGVSLFIQQDDGTFSMAASEPCNCAGAWAADVEMDGDLDVGLICPTDWAPTRIPAAARNFSKLLRPRAFRVANILMPSLKGDPR